MKKIAAVAVIGLLMCSYASALTIDTKKYFAYRPYPSSDEVLLLSNSSCDGMPGAKVAGSDSEAHKSRPEKMCWKKESGDYSAFIGIYAFHEGKWYKLNYYRQSDFISTKSLPKSAF